MGLARTLNARLTLLHVIQPTPMAGVDMGVVLPVTYLQEVEDAVQGSMEDALARVTAAGLTERLAEAPGFIRRFNFADGPHYTLIALWRTRAEAHAFFSSDEHQAAMRELFRNRWQYSHFAALWDMTTPRQRVIFCQRCDGVTAATERLCVGCGTELFDPFRSPSHVDG